MFKVLQNKTAQDHWPHSGRSDPKTHSCQQFHSFSLSLSLNSFVYFVPGRNVCSVWISTNSLRETNHSAFFPLSSFTHILSFFSFPFPPPTFSPKFLACHVSLPHSSVASKREIYFLFFFFSSFFLRPNLIRKFLFFSCPMISHSYFENDREQSNQ